MALPLAALMIPQMAQVAIGGLQTLFGKKREDQLNRPTRTVAPAVQESVSRNRYLAQAGQAPGSELMAQNIQTGQAGAVNQIQKAGGTSGQTLSAALGAQANANRGLQQLGVQNQQFKLGANTQFMQSLQQLAQEQQMNFQWNQAQKFQEEAQAAAALKGGGLQNIMGGLTAGAKTAFAHEGLMQQDQTQSPFWNQKQGYMGTMEMYQAKQQAAMNAYKQKLQPPQAPPPSNPMHGQFGEGINTQGFMNQWMPQMSQLQALSQPQQVTGP